MTKTRNYFWIILVAVALVAAIILLFGVFDKKSKEEIKKPGFDTIERVINLVNNSSFEHEFAEDNWQLRYPGLIGTGFDDIIKRHGEYSYSLSAEHESNKLIIFQKVKGIEVDKRYTLFGFVKVEDADSARLEMKLYNKDSLLISGYSTSVKGTSDWVEQTAWLKTYLPGNVEENFLSIDINCVLFGKGRVWFDNVRMYSIPEKETIYNYDFNPLKKEHDKN